MAKKLTKVELEQRIRELTVKIDAKRKQQGDDRAEKAKILRRILRRKARLQKLEAWRRRRKRQLAKIASAGARAAVDGALRHVGEHEEPYGSNKGPGIVSRCQIYWLGYDGWFWCGGFAGFCAKVYGKADALDKDVIYTPSIVNNGKAGADGCSIVGMNDGHPGDFFVHDFDGGVADHVGLIVENLGGGNYRVVEGNTSPEGGSGSQDNGGGVYLRTRNVSICEAIVRPTYPVA